jgi:predicted 3-demethylubiquinone-9 3-methyltransferase (glyoxalase superfamily)
MPHIHTCLWYDHNVESAFDQYSQAFPDTSFGRDNDYVYSLDLMGNELSGIHGGPHFKHSPAASMFVLLDSKEEVEQAWVSLSTGGQVIMKLENYPWSEYYGYCADAYGVSWQVMLRGSIPHIESSVAPCLLFVNEKNGLAHQAIEDYIRIFNGEKISVSTYPEIEGESPKILHAIIALEDHFQLRIMDGEGQHEFDFTEAMSFIVEVKNQDELDHYWHALTAGGGQESKCGWCKDKYGVSWQVVPKGLSQMLHHPRHGKSIQEALLLMQKIEISKLEQVIHSSQ